MFGWGKKKDAPAQESDPKDQRFEICESQDIQSGERIREILWDETCEFVEYPEASKRLGCQIGHFNFRRNKIDAFEKPQASYPFDID